MPNPRRLTHSRGTSWEITYRLDGRVVRQRFDSRPLAVNALARARAQALEGLGIAPADDGKTTLAEYAPRWLAAQQCRPSTLAIYDSHVRNHLVPMLGRRPPSAGRAAAQRHQRLRRRPHPQAARHRDGRDDLPGAGDDPALGRARPAARRQPLLQDQAAGDAAAVGRAAVPGGAGRAAGDHRGAEDHRQSPCPAAPPVRRHRAGPAPRGCTRA